VEWLPEAAPSVTRMRIAASRPQPPALLTAVQASARALQVPVAPPVIVKSVEELPSTLSQAKREGVGGLIFPRDAFTGPLRQRVVELVATSRIPAIYGQREWVEAGGLMSYGPSFVANFRRAVPFVDRVLKVARLGDLPVEQPTTFEFVRNARAARSRGLALAPTLLARADEVLQ